MDLTLPRIPYEEEVLLWEKETNARSAGKYIGEPLEKAAPRKRRELRIKISKIFVSGSIPGLLMGRGCPLNGTS